MVNECCSMVVVRRARKVKPFRPTVQLGEFIRRGSVEIGGENSVKMYTRGQNLVIAKGQA